MPEMFFNSCSIFIPNRSFLLSGSTALFAVLLSLTVSYAQKTVEIDSGMNGNDQIEGKIFFPPGDMSGTRPLIKLQSLSSPEVTGVTDHEGKFRFTHLRPDIYTVIVDGGDVYEKATDTVNVGFTGSVPAQGDPGSYAVPFVYQVQFYLKHKRLSAATESPVTSNTAFASVPEPVRELFRQALENGRADNHEKAIEQLKSVISQAPRFAFAYNELAAQYLKIGSGDQAVKTLKEAVGIDPNDLNLRLNYGVALLNQKKFEAAETELRLVIQKNADSLAANYYLGLTLISEQKFDEAQSVFEKLIKNGGDKIALAHRSLGGIYLRNNQYRKAADELEKYLKVEPNVADAEKIRGTIKELRNKI
jgi:Tfp pilus assembly protein PilF